MLSDALSDPRTLEPGCHARTKAMPSYSYEGFEFYILGTVDNPAPHMTFYSSRERERAANEPDPRAIGGDNYATLVNETRRIAMASDTLDRTDFDADTLEAALIKYGALKPEPGRSTDELFKTAYENVRRDAKALGEALLHIGGTDLMLNTIHLYVPNILGLHRTFDYFFDGIGEWKC